CEPIPIRSSYDSKHNLIVRNVGPRRRRAPGSGAFQTAVVRKSVPQLRDKPPLLEKKKHVSITKRSAFMTSKASTQISGPTSENQPQIDPAGNRQPRATATIRRGYGQFLILRNKSAVT